MPNYDRLTVVACLAAVGLGSYLLLEPPRWWLLLLTVAVGAGAWLSIRAHPVLSSEDSLFALGFAPLPALVVPAAALNLEPFVQGGWAIFGAAITGALVFGTLVAEWYTVVPGMRTARARLALNLLTYLAVFGLYNAVDTLRLEGFPALGWAGMATLLLSVEIVRESTARKGRTWLYAVVAAIVVVEVRWAVAFWPLEGSTAAIFLVLVFYLVTGIIHSHFAGQLTRATLMEFTVVMLIALAVLFGARMVTG